MRSVASAAGSGGGATGAEPDAVLTGPGVVALTQGSVSHLWLIDVDAGARQQLTSGRRPDETASWAPDGTRLVFADTRRVRVPGLAAAQLTPLIAILNLGTHAVTTLTDGAGFDEDPAWSPDGRRITFSRTAMGGNVTAYPEIWTMRTSGRAPRRLTRNSVADAGPAWSRDGRSIAFARLRRGTSDSWDIWTMRADGASQRRLVRGGTRPAWSPDGARLAYGRPKRSAGSDPCGCERDLYVADRRARTGGCSRPMGPGRAGPPTGRASCSSASPPRARISGS